MLNFKEAFNLIKNNNNISEKKLTDLMLKDMRNGKLNFEIGNGKSIDDFYGWCKHNVDRKIDATNPLNWITLALYSSMMNPLDKPLNVQPIIDAIKKQLINKEYEFTIIPALLLPVEIEEFSKENIYYSTTGILINDKKNNYFAMKTKRGNILLKFCWIIKEITND